MKVAVIGWGSLIWAPGSLAVSTRWHRDGPKLPVEFARASTGGLPGRVTLVIVPGAPVQQTYWALSAHPDLPSATSNLIKREGTSDPQNILSAQKGAPADTRSPGHAAIVAWLSTVDVDAAIWSGFSPSPSVSTPAKAVARLASLKSGSPALAAAREYVTHTPKQIDTPVRKAMREDHGWMDVDLPDTLFEP